MDEIGPLKELGDIVAVIDRYLSSAMGRAVTFTSSKGEMTCGRISRAGNAQPLTISMPVNGNSLLHKALADGSVFFGDSADPVIAAELYSRIGEPAVNRLLVLPFKCLGRSLAVSYADFGTKQPAAVQLDLITTLARYAGLVYENALYRKKFEKMLQAQN
jgi:hypothetical protein